MTTWKGQFFYTIFIFGTIICLSSCKEELVDYSLHVKPILNKRCIACHGGVKKQGGFSLLFEEEAKAQLKSGKFGIVPGDPGKSEMIRRLTLHDPEERMPLEADPLPEDEIALLTKWISQGAKWGQHWAFEPVKDHSLPEAGRWSKNDIDHFIEAKANAMDLTMSEEAPPEVLARRLALDLIGFPAPESLTKAYLQQPNDNTYEALVDSLLGNPHFGEKWTSMWLDIARYADTKGYERDSDRNIWRYRDWLIRSFNEDKPYDQMIMEQMAGDFLPNPSDDQLIATAFHRNTMTNDEGGTDNEEFRVAAVLDRVNTTWESLMSTTFACVQCHSHPYDPIKHEDYYRFMAYFNNSRDNDAYAEYPVLRHFDDVQRKQLDDFGLWANEALGTEKAKQIKWFLKTFQPSINSLETDQFVNSELSDTKWLAMRNHSSARLSAVDLTGVNHLIFRYSSGLKIGTLTIHTDQVNGPVIGTFLIKKPTQGWQMAQMDLDRHEGVHDLFFTFESKELTDPLRTGIQFDWFHFNDGKVKQFPEEQRRAFWELLDARADQTPIMVENVPVWRRETRIFERGSWLSKGEKVNPGVPDIFTVSNKNYPPNRLGLAMWMTAPEHPLTSRTMVNRVWEQIFGRGLVETLEDLGSQGAYPSHPELLDHLSHQFMTTQKWSVKQLIKSLVMSATYRQDSKVTADHLAKDPFNIYLARGPRTRLTAEQIRDQALALSGKMFPQMYGPSVMPYQPEGVWLSPYNGKKWIKSEGDRQYRRALYTFWKRTAPYPSMVNFDGVGREVCSARRINTNTPLQALTTLNDSVYVDLAWHFAKNVYQPNIDVSISKAYKKAVGREIDPERKKALRNLYETAYTAFKNKEDAEVNALALVTNAIFNLDEVISKN